MLRVDQLLSATLFGRVGPGALLLTRAEARGIAALGAAAGSGGGAVPDGDRQPAPAAVRGSGAHGDSPAGAPGGRSAAGAAAGAGGAPTGPSGPAAGAATASKELRCTAVPTNYTTPGGTAGRPRRSMLLIEAREVARQPKPSTTADSRQAGDDIARFRHGVIADMLCLPAGSRQRAALIRANTKQDYEIPHSRRRRVGQRNLRRWVRRDRQAGYERLRPQPRADRGRSRRIAPERDVALQDIKAGNPRLSTQLMHQSRNSLDEALSHLLTAPNETKTLCLDTNLRLAYDLSLAESTHVSIATTRSWHAPYGRHPVVQPVTWPTGGRSLRKPECRGYSMQRLREESARARGSTSAKLR